MTGQERKPGADRRDEFVDRAAELFQESVDRVDGTTRSKLTEGRHAALKSLNEGRSTDGSRMWIPASGIAAAAALAIFLWSDTAQQPVGKSAVAIGELSDFEILMEEDSLEMLEELEFYAWMVALKENGADVG